MNKIFDVKFGSHLYGTDTEKSDIDYKSIYLPTAKEIVLNKYKKTINISKKKGEGERNTKDDIDIEIISLDQYLKLLTTGQTMALDILFAPQSFKSNINNKTYWIFDKIFNNKLNLFTKQTTAFINYARQQASKYGLKGSRLAALESCIKELGSYNINLRLNDIELELSEFVTDIDNNFITWATGVDKNGITEKYFEVLGRKFQMNIKIKDALDILRKIWENYGKRAQQAKDNEGVDFKALSHAVRVNNQGIELFNTGHITFPRPDKQLLLDIKLGNKPYSEVADIITQGLEDLQKAANECTIFPDKPDLDWCDELIYETYSKIIKGEL